MRRKYALATALGVRQQRQPSQLILEIVAHDRPSGDAASDDLEAGAQKCRGMPSPGRTPGDRGVDRIGFEGRRFGALRCLQGGGDEGRRDAALSVADAYVEAGERPHGHVVDALETPGAIEPGHVVAGRDLTPANGAIAVEGEQAGRWSTPNDGVEVGLVRRARTAVVGTPDAPVHAPTAVARALLAKEINEGRPQVGRQWADGQLRSCGLWHA